MHTSRMTRTAAVCGLALAGSATAAIAQSGMGTSGAAPGPVQFGLEGGASISNFTGNDRPDMSNRTGTYGGLTILLQPQSSAIGFQTGVLYMEKGAKSNGDLTTFGGGINFRYIEVPLLARFGVPMSFAGVSPTLLAGASLGYRFGCKIETTLGGVKEKVDCDDGYADASDDNFDSKRFDAGVSVGVEVPFAVGGRVILVPSVRYNRSLTNVVNGSDNEVRNSNVLIGVGIRFR